jgi:endonuclease G
MPQKISRNQNRKTDFGIDRTFKSFLRYIGPMKKLSQIIFVLFLAAGWAEAREIACPVHFAGGAAPEITNPKLNPKIQVLCFEGFALLHSAVSRTPLWSAENLTPARLREAKHLKRKNAFHAEEQLPIEDRSELHDYSRSGFDRGHMSPSGDMPTATAQFESFSLANMVPQNPNNNQNLWEGIESSVRYLTSRRSELFVITGPIFDDTPVKRLNGRVFIPSHLFKAVYDPAREEAGAYIAPNAPGMDYQTVSIADLEKRIGINLFPKMPQQLKEKKMDLPEPKPHDRKGGRGRHQGFSDNQTYSEIARILFH